MSLDCQLVTAGVNSHIFNSYKITNHLGERLPTCQIYF